MKNLINKNNTIVILVIAVLIISVGGFINQSIKIAEAKAELLKAQEPSKIEIQHKELIDMEVLWNNKNLNIISLRETANKLEKEKLELEPKIRAKRNEILGIKK